MVRNRSEMVEGNVSGSGCIVPFSPVWIQSRSSQSISHKTIQTYTQPTTIGSLHSTCIPWVIPWQASNNDYHHSLSTGNVSGKNGERRTRMETCYELVMGSCFPATNFSPKLLYLSVVFILGYCISQSLDISHIRHGWYINYKKLLHLSHFNAKVETKLSPHMKTSQSL